MSNETLSQLQVELKKAQQKIADLEAQLRTVSQIPVSYKNNGGFVGGEQANDGARREKEKVNALFLNAPLPKKVEDASQESEAKYRLLFEMMTQGVVFQDEAGRILHANPAAEKILGLTVEQMQGRSSISKDWPSIHEDGSALLAGEHPVAIVMKTKQPVHNMIMGVFNPLRKSYIWLNINSVPRFLEGGTSPYQIFTTFEDITERKKIEFALRESEAKYRSLIDSQESAISTIDADGVIHYMNSHGAAPFGTPETVAGKKLYDLFPPQVAEWQVSQIRQVIESGKGLVHEYQNLVAGRPNWRRVSIQPIINADSGVRLATVNSLDITERKRAEEELRNSERKYRDLLNGMNDTVWVIDDDLSILDVNTAAVSTLGYTREELLSMRVPDFDVSLSPDAIQNLVNTMPADKFQVFQTEHTTKDGRKIPVEISSSLVTYNGKTAIMSIARDISERMQAEEKIRESESRYQQFVSLALEAISRTEFENPIDTSLPVEQQIDLVYENAYIAECNQAMADMYDTTVEALIGKRIVEIHGGGDNLVNRNAIRKFIAGGYQSINNETKEYSVNGAPVWILNNTVGIVRDGMLLRLWETSIDITERKRAQEDLYLAEQRYRAMIEHAPDGIVLITVDGKFKYASPSVERIFGYVQEDLQALNSVSMTHPDDLPKVLGELQKLLEDQSYIPTVQYRFLHKNGEWRWIESTFSNLLATPNVEAIIINFRDIHERRLADEELKKSQNLLKESQRIGRIGYMEWSVNSPNLICSDEIYDIFNIPPGCPVTKDLISTMLRPDENEKLRELDHQATIHRADINYEYSIFTRDGNERCIHQTGKITYDETGNPIRKMLIVQDVTERKQAEKQLQRNEQVLRLFVEHSPAAIAMFDREMRYIIASQRYLIDYRLGDQSLIGCSHYEVFPEMDEGRKAIHRRCLAGEVVKHEGDPLPRVDGTLDWVRYELRPWYEVDGSIGGLIFFSEVITERKQAEEKLRASEEKYRGLIESLGSIVATIDAHGTFLYLNDLAASSLGGSAAELTGKSMYDYFPPKYAESQMEAIRQVIESDKAVVFESQSYVQDELRWYRTSIQPIHDEDGKVSHALTNTTDINDIKTIQHELEVLNRTLEEKINQRTAEVQDLYNNAPVGYHSLDVEGKYVQVNQTELDWLGYHREEMLGRSFAEFVTAQDATLFQGTFQLLKNNGRVTGLEFNMRRKDGSTFPALLNAVAVFDEHGNYLRSRSTIFDNTERKKAEDALRVSHDQLAAANIDLEKAIRVKDEFLASMSHELRTPLTGILGLSEAIQLGTYGGLNEKQKKTLQSINDSGNHLLSLINDILDLSKIEAGKLEMQITPCSLGDICQSSLQLTKGMAHQKHQFVSYSPPAEAILLNVDARRAKQILVNLLSNAIKFTPENGELGLDVEPDAVNHRVRLIVWDKGIGIKAENLEKLFKPFTQIDSSLAREYSGTGLGLSLVQRLVKLHNGTVEVESVFGKGSRFIVSLPWTPDISASNSPKADSTQLTSSPSNPAAPDASPVILVADDNPVLLTMLADFLEASHYRAVKAESGRDVLDNIAATRPDLVLMDIQMPGMDGLMTIRHIRTHPDPVVASTKIIAVTALAMVGDRERCLATGANEYISKPVKLKELKQMIESQLGKL